ncbi:hypothetical protein ABZT43_25820, partial [Streptomyces sp. NPDC005349]
MNEGDSCLPCGGGLGATGTPDDCPPGSRDERAFTSDARPNSVVANAAVVQRRGDDGDWVGQSG